MTALAYIARWSTAPFATVRAALLAGTPAKPILDDDGRRDLRGIDLRGAPLARVDLRHASLDFANFANADLAHANLDAATLRFACLREARLAHASLRFADLSFANCAGADFVEARLRDANLTQAVLAGADVRAADLRGAFLRFCDMMSAWTWGARFASIDDVDLARRAPGAVLHRRLRSPWVLRAAEGLGWGARNLDVAVLRALARKEWREQLVAATVACAAADRLHAIDRVVDALWKVLPQSAVAPQLVAACFVLDEDFFERAALLRPAWSSYPEGLDAMHVVDVVSGRSSPDERNNGVAWLVNLHAGIGAAARRAWRRTLSLA